MVDYAIEPATPRLHEPVSLTLRQAGRGALSRLLLGLVPPTMALCSDLLVISDDAKIG